MPPSSAVLKTGQTSSRNCGGAFHLPGPRVRLSSISVPRVDGSVGRCLVPASHFFEFAGTKSPKTKWKFTKSEEDWFCFAGLWRPMAAGGEAFTLLTTDPSPDVAPIHDRQMVVLEYSDWSAWLEQTGKEADLLRALPPGFLAGRTGPVTRNSQSVSPFAGNSRTIRSSGMGALLVICFMKKATPAVAQISRISRAHCSSILIAFRPL